MNILLRTCALIPFLVATSIFGQANAAPSFEVATAKPAAPLDMQKLAAQIQAGQMPRLGPHVEADRASYTYMTLKSLIALAYKVKEYQVSGPEWLGSERFDIEAKLPDGASKDDAPAMLQSLLAERFKLATHRDTSEHKVLALVVGKNGPKLKESPPAAPIDENAPLKPGEMKMEGPDGPIRMTRNPDGSATVNMGAKGTMTQKMDPQTQTMHIESSKVTMAGFADMLTSMMQIGGAGGRQVVDQTGLKGNYQVSVDLSLADIFAMARSQGMMQEGARPPAMAGGGSGESAAAVPTASDPSSGTTVYQSVEKLGLKLEERKATITQLIVDRAEKTPVEN